MEKNNYETKGPFAPVLIRRVRLRFFRGRDGRLIQ